MAVVIIPPMIPSVISAHKIASAAFTATLPSNNVQSNQFPYFRIGIIASAYLEFGGPADVTIYQTCVCVCVCVNVYNKIHKKVENDITNF